MNENRTCTLCPMYRTPFHRCLPGRGQLSAPLLVYIDTPNFVEAKSGHPMSSDAVQLIDYMFARMSIDKSQYYLEYVLKCYPPGGKVPSKKKDRAVCLEACSTYRDPTMMVLNPTTIIGLGRTACELLTGGTKIGDWSDCWWEPKDPSIRQYCPIIWIGPSPVAVLMNPTSSPDLYRVLWRAAEYAGLTPAYNRSVKMFNWSDFIK